MEAITDATQSIEHQQRPESLRLRILAFVTRRTGFWQSLGEMVVVSAIVSTIPYALTPLLGTAFTTLLTFVVYPLLACCAWRLAPAHGKVAWRIGRVLLWCVLFSAASGTTTWLTLEIWPQAKSLFGTRSETIEYSPGELIASTLFLTLILMLPTRVLLLLWAASRRRLRWLLTFSYVLVGTITLILIPVFFSLFVAISSLAITPALVAPLDTATRLAQAFSPTLQADVPPGELSPLLDELLAGRAQLPIQPGQTDAEIQTFGDLSAVSRLTMLRADGIVLAGAGATRFPDGEMLPEPQRIDWRLTLDSAASGCVAARPADGPLAEAAVCPITAGDGRIQAFLVVENRTDGRAQWGATLGRIVGVTLLGTSFTLLLAVPIIVPVLLLAFGIGALIARQISRRVERLTLAASDVAAGNYARRITIDREDELGQLSVDFNAMAAQLQQREHALATEAARAEAALEANKRLVANVSHELRTPLTTLRGYVEALEQEYGDALPRRDLAVIHGEVDRLTGLIEDLFTLARAEAQQLPLTIETVDVRALVTRLVDTLAPLARRNRQIELVCALPAELPPVQADRGRLEQVLLNLVQNALRHTPTGGIIAIEGIASATSVVLTVADTGEGIAPEDLPLVFERFYRSDQSRARETGGAGLGLALARELAHAMGGEISATSDPGRGSRFAVTLRRG